MERSTTNKIRRAKANGSISEQKYNESKDKIEQIVQSQQLTKVTVGIGYTDIDLSELKKIMKINIQKNRLDI